jgi:hypothetical protein
MVPVAREVFEYQMIPWIGRDYAAWLRTAARPHPADPHRLVLVPERVYQVFKERRPGETVTRAQLETMRYPRLPDEDDLENAYRDQRLAAEAGDTRRVNALHQQIETLVLQVEAARRAMETWRATDPEELQQKVAHELASAPHADVLVGIPSEAYAT